MGIYSIPIAYKKRKVRDSNPRYHVMGIPDFESSAFGHSANLPKTAVQNYTKNAGILMSLDGLTIFNPFFLPFSTHPVT